MDKVVQPYLHHYVSGHNGSQQSSRAQMCIPRSHILQLLLVNPEALPDQMGFVLPLALP